MPTAKMEGSKGTTDRTECDLRNPCAIACALLNSSNLRIAECQPAGCHAGIKAGRRANRIPGGDCRTKVALPPSRVTPWNAQCQRPCAGALSLLQACRVVQVRHLAMQSGANAAPGIAEWRKCGTSRCRPESLLLAAGCLMIASEHTPTGMQGRWQCLKQAKTIAPANLGLAESKCVSAPPPRSLQWQHNRARLGGLVMAASHAAVLDWMQPDSSAAKFLCLTCPPAACSCFQRCSSAYRSWARCSWECSRRACSWLQVSIRPLRCWACRGSEE